MYQQQQQMPYSYPMGWQSAQGLPQSFLSAGASPAHASTAPRDSNTAVLLMQQQAGQQQQQPLAHAATTVPASSGRRQSSRQGKDAAKAMAFASPAKLRQLSKQLQQKVQQQGAARMGSCGISSVSSDLTQMLTFSVSASSESEAAGDDSGSIADNQ
jgi:hypothetical protein